MGAWGITMRESDYGLDLLGTVVKAQLKQTDFSVFHVTEAIELLRQDILEEIKRANRSCPPEKLDYYYFRAERPEVICAMFCGCRCLQRRAKRFKSNVLFPSFKLGNNTSMPIFRETSPMRRS